MTANHPPAAPQNIYNAEDSRFSQTFRALKHRNYQLFFAGQLVSLSGTWMQSVAQSWLVYKLTGSAVLLGLVGFSGQIPVFLLATFGGAACIVGAIIFASNLPAFRIEARRIVVALQMTAGDPANETTLSKDTVLAAQKA